MMNPYDIAVSTSTYYNAQFAGSPLAVDCPDCGNPAGTTCTGAAGKAMGNKVFHHERQVREQELAARRRSHPATRPVERSEPGPT